jgi:hypothetical protein
MTAGPAASLRCAPVARALGYVPTGTAAAAPALLLVEAPLPWPRDVGAHPLLAPLAPLPGPHGVRLQGLVPNGTSPDGHVRVILYRQPGGPLARYVRHERVVPADRLGDEVATLLDGAAAGTVDPDADADPDLVDVLVCTHGSRDACCGRDGTRIHLDLLARDLPGVRVWRTSHTGGHRFAPTAITLPDGRAWAFVDGDLLADVVTRTAPLATVAAHDRGCAGLSDPFAQAAEGAVLAAEGWGWLDRPREVAVVRPGASGDDAAQVTVVGRPDGNGQGATVAYRADVVVRRVVPVPDCGRPLEEATKTARELEVVTLERLE